MKGPAWIPKVLALLVIPAVGLAALAEAETQILSDQLVQVETTKKALDPERFPAEATWYGPKYDGRLTASGVHKSKAVPEAFWRFDMFDFTAAHLSLPFGTMVRVWFLDRHVDVMITDRPAKGNDVLDLCAAGFHQLAPLRKGPGRLNVIVEVLP